jgi:hypothetical protein
VTQQSTVRNIRHGRHHRAISLVLLSTPTHFDPNTAKFQSWAIPEGGNIVQIKRPEWVNTAIERP